MIGYIIKQLITEGALGHVHNQYFPIKRIILPELNNLTITFHEDQIYVFEMQDSEYEKIVEVDVPQEIIDIALQYNKIKTKLTSWVPVFINNHTPKLLRRFEVIKPPNSFIYLDVGRILVETGVESGVVKVDKTNISSMTIDIITPFVKEIEPEVLE